MGPLQPFRGTWSWVRSEGGLAMQVRTPASEGVTVTLAYDGHVARTYRDGDLAGSALYTAVELSTTGPLPVVRVVYSVPLAAFPFDALDEHTIYIAGPDSVLFVDPCCDRWSHVLVATARR